MSETMQSEIVPAGQVAQTRQAREIRVVQDAGPVANLMDTARFEHLQRVAQLMANSSLLPDHLRYERGNNKSQMLPAQTQAANCFRIVNQALRWNMDPFAIIDETYVVGGKLGYSGKLVAAVVNSRASLKARLRYEFTGQGDNRTVQVIGVFEGEAEQRSVELRLADAKTDNQMWRKDPEQKLIYSGVVKWARRHCPEVVLGVITDDDLERMAANQPSQGSNLNDRLRELESSKAETPLNGVASLNAKLDKPKVDTSGNEAPASPNVTKSAPPRQKAKAPQQPQPQPQPQPEASTQQGEIANANIPGPANETGDEVGELTAPPDDADIRDAMDQEWPEVRSIFVKAMVADLDITRIDADSALGRWLLVIGKKGKEETISIDERVRLYKAIKAKTFDSASGKIAE